MNDLSRLLLPRTNKNYNINNTCSCLNCCNFADKTLPNLAFVCDWCLAKIVAGGDLIVAKQ